MKIGFTCGAFDLFHAGHVLMLSEAKEKCDWLIVGLHTDPSIDRPETKRKPVQSTLERHIQLKGCRFVDEIIPYDTEHDLLNILLTHKINYRFIGGDYYGKSFTGDDLKHFDIVYTSRYHDYSSSELIERVKNGK
jgi:glycerol-3-phosphate cytidylyltransferase